MLKPGMTLVTITSSNHSIVQGAYTVLLISRVLMLLSIYSDVGHGECRLIERLLDHLNGLLVDAMTDCASID